MHRRSVMLVMMLAVSVPLAVAESPPTSSVTIYSRDLAFVRETRVLEFGARRDTATLAGIPDRIDVSSIRLVPSGKGRVRRLAYSNDPAAGERWLERSRGRRVRLSLRGERVIEGVLAGADGAWIVVRTDDGATETVARGAVDQIRMTDPPALRLEPTLDVVLEGGAGRVSSELSYLTGGLSWSAEHSLLRTGEKTGQWTSRVAVENASGRSFDVPRLALVAGDPRHGSAPPMPMMRTMAMEAGQAKADFDEAAFSDYHLYTLDRPARLNDRETQLFVMLEPRAVQIAPRYLARPGAGVAIQLLIKNTRAAGLGEPLPGGRVRVYEKDASGNERFTGEAGIAHTPEGEEMTLEIGTAFDLVAERRELSTRVISERERESTIEVKLRNRKKTPVTIVVEEPVAGDHEVVKTSHEATHKDANTLQFSIPVPAGKETVLTYTVRMRY